MSTDSREPLKTAVLGFWNAQSCDTQIAKSSKYSLNYFEELESFRYFDQPFIHSFAQFSRYYGKRVLEVGVGAGTDFIQWLRAGAIASGIDLTPEAIANTRKRVSEYGLPSPEQLLVGDAENLPFDSGMFDLGYSFGVLHHTPNTLRGIRELVRVVKPGGEIKLMLYNRRSIYVLNKWFKSAALKGRPWRSLTWTTAHFIESPGTKAYTRTELRHILDELGLEQAHVHTHITSGDWLSASALWPLSFLYRLAIRVCGESYPWRTDYYARRINDPELPQEKPAPPLKISSRQFTGNRLGFYHCIRATKAA